MCWRKYFHSYDKGVLMRYQFYFCECASNALEEFLQSHSVRYKYHDHKMLAPDQITFSLYTDDPRFDTIEKKLMEQHHRAVARYLEFTDEELSSARYLWLWPRKQQIEISNEKQAYQETCQRLNQYGNPLPAHRTQITDFLIRKEPSTKSNTAFWNEKYGFAELFTDWRVVALVEAHNMKGIGFRSVKIKKDIDSDTIFQVVSEEKVCTSNIVLGYGEREIICPICRNKRYYIDAGGSYQLHVLSTQNWNGLDFLMTEKIWGDGAMFPIYIISQKFYRLLREHNLAGGVAFYPIAEVGL